MDEAAIEREILELHEHLVTWMRGDAEDTDAVFEALIGGRFGDDFFLIAPSGARPGGAAVLRGLRDSHGSNPDLGIQITDLSILRLTADTAVALCVEWQRNARRSTPSDNGRLLTCVFAADSERPNGVRWVHLHESWLHADEMAAKVYDF